MNLAGLAAFSGGAQQGWAQAQQLRDQAVQLQQHQLALDTAKKQLAAQAAAFANLGGGQGGGMSALPGASSPPPPPPTAQPMPPGQPSQPSPSPAAGNMPPQPAAAPTPAGQPPAGGSSPPQSQAGAGGAPDASGGQPPGQQQIDPMAGYKIALQIAKEIKTRNPGIDPQTLFSATEQVINLSKGLDPMLRQQAQVVVQNMKDQTSRANTQDRDATSSSNTDKHVGAQERGQDISSSTRLKAVGEQVQAALQRTQFIQSQLTQRAQSGQASKAQMQAGTDRIKTISAQLTNANRTLATLKNSVTGQVDDNDPRVKQAEAQVQDAQKKLQQMETVLKTGPTPAAAPAPAPAPAGGAAQQTATDAKGNKVMLVDGKWVPAPAGK